MQNIKCEKQDGYQWMKSDKCMAAMNLITWEIHNDFILLKKNKSGVEDSAGNE